MMSKVDRRLSRTVVAIAAAFVGATTQVPVSAAAGPGEVSGSVMAKIEAIATRDGAHGIYLDKSGTVVIVTPRSRTSTVSALDTAQFGVPVRLQATDVTVDEVAEMDRDLLRFRAALPPAYAYAYYFDLATGRMLVQTDAPVGSFADISTKYLSHVDVQYGARVGLAYDRLGDGRAYWGGAAVNGTGDSGGTALCSTGYLVKNSSRTFMVTAGHCFTLNATVRANKYAGTGLSEGTVKFRNYPWIDAELIGGDTYAPVIYSGVQGDQIASTTILGRKWAWNGQTGYCRTGVSSGRVCDWTVGGSGATYCASWPSTCTGGLYAFSGTPTIGGDSGGPIYYPYQGGALITGSVVGYTCQLGCTSYGEPISQVLAYWTDLTQACSGTCTVQP